MPQNRSMAKNQNVVMEGVRILFRNFEGKETQYNRKGDRNFSVVIDEPTARAMAEDGWNIKWLKPREDAEEGEEPTAFLDVAVGYKGRPPRIEMITSRGRTPISESLVETLDWVEIANVDLIIRPYNWDVNGKSGIKAYLQSLYVTIEEDALQLKYGDMPLQSSDPLDNVDGQTDEIPF